MAGYIQITNKLDSHPAVNWSQAPEWATHAGRDERGWSWFNHIPFQYSQDQLCTGVLYEIGEQYHYEEIEGHYRNGSGELAYVARPTRHWKTWVAGNIVRQVRQSDEGVVGELYVVTRVERSHYTGTLPVEVCPLDNPDNTFWPTNDGTDRTDCVLEWVAEDRASLTAEQITPVETPSHKDVAIRELTKLRDAAVEYRSTGVRKDGFEPTYGICSNIEEMCKPYRVITNVKNNLICRTPSFSGSYHYPVPGGEGAWDRYENKWQGDYGAARLQQLEELLALVHNEWDDKLIKTMSPAERNGFVLGQMYMEVSTGFVWEFTRDDDSANPEFYCPSTSERKYKDLSTMMPVKDTKKRTVGSLTKAATRILAKQAKIKAQIEKLQAAVRGLDVELKAVDSALATQHKVKRI